MRIATVWIAGHQGEELLREAAQITALTHADPPCVLSSVFLVGFLGTLSDGVPYEDAARAAWERA